MFDYMSKMSQAEDSYIADENSLYNDKGSLLEKKKRSNFFKKNQKRSRGTQDNINESNLSKCLDEHQTDSVNGINAEQITNSNVINEIDEQNIDAESIATDVLEDSATSCCGFLSMFRYLKRKLFRNETSTQSKRAKCNDKKTKDNEASSSHMEPNQSNSNEVNEIQDNKVVEKRKKRNRSRHRSSNDTSELPEEIRNNPKLKKYWVNRYRLFSKYDEGIKLDAESWYSVTPEKISEEIARRCQCDVIIDAFCGAGGNTIQFAFVCERVIAVDIDPEKIKLANHNAKIYGVADRIEFVVGDFFQLAPSLTADVVFLSPPWGGPCYKSIQDFPMNQIMKPYGGEHLYHLAKQISDHIAYFLPRNLNASEIEALEPEKYVRIDKNYLDNRMVAITAYFGDLVEDYGDEWNN